MKKVLLIGLNPPLHRSSPRASRVREQLQAVFPNHDVHIVEGMTVAQEITLPEVQHAD